MACNVSGVAWETVGSHVTLRSSHPSSLHRAMSPWQSAQTAHTHKSFLLLNLLRALPPASVVVRYLQSETRMPEPKIKEEESSEPPLSAISSKRRGMITTPFAASPSDRSSDEDDAKPPLSRRLPQIKLLTPRPHSPAKPPTTIKTERSPTRPSHVVAALPAPVTHREILPLNCQMRGVGVARGRRGTCPPPMASWLSSRAISAFATPQQTVVATTTYHNTTFLAGGSLTRPHRIFGDPHAPLTNTRRIARTARMDEFDLGGDGAAGTGGELDFNELDAYTGVQGESYIGVCTTCRPQ